jgi:hypothetical protein
MGIRPTQILTDYSQVNADGEPDCGTIPYDGKQPWAVAPCRLVVVSRRRWSKNRENGFGDCRGTVGSAEFARP